MKLYLWLSGVYAKAQQLSLFSVPAPGTGRKTGKLIPQKRTVKREGKTFQQTFWVDPSQQVTAPRQPSLFESAPAKPTSSRLEPKGKPTQAGLFDQVARDFEAQLKAARKPASSPPEVKKPTAPSAILARYANPDDGTEAHVTRHERGFAATLRDADAGESVATKIYPTRERADEAARRMVGLEPAQASAASPSILPPKKQLRAAEKSVAKLLRDLKLHERIMESDDFHVRLENDPYLDLVIERHGNELYLTHYLGPDESTGFDTLLDAEMVYHVKPDGSLWLKETAVRGPRGESRRYDRSFATMFARNLNRQGFGKAKPKAEPQPPPADDGKDASSSGPLFEAPPRANTITRAEWDKVPDDYKSVIDGKPHVLRLDAKTGATVLEPVTIAEPASPERKEKLIAERRDEGAAKASALDYDRPLSEILGSLPKFGFDLLEKATPAQRKSANQRAIELADKLLAERRPPTAEERRTLAAYTGDGGVTGDINAHYTPTRVAAAMWRLLARAGFGGGRVLEPSMGAGVFKETAPANASLTGVELSETTSKIASLLHPDVELHGGKPFEEYNTTSDDELFDAVIANPPYGVRGIFAGIDKPELQQAERYFISTSLDRLKDGGVAAFLINTGPLESGTARAYRAELLARAEVLGVYQLPSSTFKESNSGVPPAVLVLRKRPSEVGTALARLVEHHGESALEAAGVADEAFLSGSSLSQPENVFGSWGGEYAFKGYKKIAGELDDDTLNRLAEAPFREEHGAPSSPAELERFMVQGGVTDADGVASALAFARNRGYPIMEGTIHPNGKWIFKGHRWHRIDEGNPALEQGIGLAEELERFMQLRKSGSREAEAARQALAERVQRFLDTHGDPNQDASFKQALKRNNRLAHLLAAVEDGKLASYLSEPLRSDDGPEVEQTNPHSLARYLARRGELTPANLSRRWIKDAESGTFASQEDAEAFLREHYAVDEAGRWLPSQDFYFGNVVERQAAMDAAAKAAERRGDGELAAKYREQKARFRELLPEKSLEEFEVTARSKWIPLNAVEAFVEQVLDPDSRYDVTLENGVFYVEKESGGYVPPVVEDFRRYLNHSTKVEVVRQQQRRSRQEIEAERKANIERAKALEEQFARQFQNWLGASDYREAVERAYNEKINNYLAPESSGEPLVIQGWEGPPLHDYQNAAVRHSLQAGNSIMALDVGLGKTFAGCALLAKLREQGKTKPVIVSPKSIMKNWRSNLKLTLPHLKLLVIGESQAKDGTWRDDSEKEVAKKLVQAATGDYDAILISRDWFGSIPVKPENVRRLTLDDVEMKRLAELRDDADTGKEAYRGQARRKRGKTARDIAAENEKAMQKVASKMFKHMVNPLYFEDLGVDALIVDEGHCFPAGTLIDGKPIETLGPGDTVRAFDHASGRIVAGKVLNLQTRVPRDLYTITLEDGTNITCTGKHPFFTQEGYVFAKNMAPGDVVYRANKNLHDTLGHASAGEVHAVPQSILAEQIPAKAPEIGRGAEPVLHQALREPSAQSPETGLPRRADASKVPTLLKDVYVEQGAGLETAHQGRDGVLLREVVRHEVEAGATTLEADLRSGHEERQRGLPGASIKGSSRGAARHSQSRVPRENQPYFANQTASTAAAGRERQRAYGAAEETSRALTRLDARVLDPDGYEARQWVSGSLQGGSGASRLAAGHRGGRAVPLLVVPAGPGPEEAGDVRGLRVVRVTVHQPTDDGTFGGLCPGGVVYNIEVERHHNYFAHDILVHNSYKNLHAAPTTFGKQPKFMGGSAESKRAQDFLFKSRLTRETAGGEGIHVLTATPTKNSPLELFNMLKHITPALEEMGLPTVDDFVTRYCEIGTAIVPNAAGELESVPAVTGFKNLEELRGIMGRFINRKTAAEVGLKIPNREDHEQYFALDPEVQQVYNVLAAQAREAAGNRDARGDEHLFSYFSRMRQLTLDPALYSPSLADKPNPRYKKAAEIAKQAIAENGKAVMFMDMGRESIVEEGDDPSGEDEATSNAYDRLVRHLVEVGIPREQIAVATADTVKSSAARGEIEEKFNAGELRVVIGSTGVIGEGFNLQKGTTDMVHLDTPWDPGTYWQRLGRAVRQGNPREKVRNHVLLAQGSFDGLTYSTMLGKRGWMQQLWDSKDDHASNDAAGVNQYEEIVAMLAADPAQAREFIRAQKQQLEQKAVQARRLQALRGLGDLARKRAALSSARERLASADRRIEEVRGKLAGEADPERRQRFEADLAKLEELQQTYRDRTGNLEAQVRAHVRGIEEDADLPAEFRPLLQGDQPFIVDDGGRVYAERGLFMMKGAAGAQPRPYRIVQVDHVKQKVAAAPLIPQSSYDTRAVAYDLADLVHTSGHAPTVSDQHYEHYLKQFVKTHGVSALAQIHPERAHRHQDDLHEALREHKPTSAYVVTRGGTLELRSDPAGVALQPGERFLLNTPGDYTLFTRHYPNGVEHGRGLPFPADLQRVSDPSAPYGSRYRYVPREEHDYAVKAVDVTPGLRLYASKPLLELAAKAYKLEGRMKWHGLDISIENAKGSVRRGVDPGGHAWATRMLYPYGYLRNTEGTDGDHLDCYVGPDEGAAKVYIVHQVDPDSGAFDEDKVMLDFASADAAKRAYLAHYDSPKFFGGMTEMPVGEFVSLVKDGKLKGKVVMGEPRARAGKAELKRLLEVAKRQRTVAGGLTYYVKEPR